MKDNISMRRKSIFTQNKKDWTTSLFKTIYEAVIAKESLSLPASKIRNIAITKKL